MLAPKTLVLELGYALLIAAALMPKPHQIRLLIAAAAAAGLAHAIWVRDRITLVWMALLLATALFMLARRLWGNRTVRFTPEEQAMLDRLFGELPRSRARHLIDQGLWLNGRAGDVLTREGEKVDHLYYLAEGEARVVMTGSQVGTCRPGDLIGELTVLSGETASATVTLNTPARFWCAPAEDLRPYVEAHEDIRRAIEHGFATVLKAKLRASNRTIAEAERRKFF
ncbi:MAG: cyclic nucleotide-binding domain-containing protein [Sphingomonadaceae bacterium]|nr:cyclic nucleotide-binding domain-containing protein [Sphingomonadaceae bacterium]